MSVSRGAGTLAEDDPAREPNVTNRRRRLLLAWLGVAVLVVACGSGSATSGQGETPPRTFASSPSPDGSSAATDAASPAGLIRVPGTRVSMVLEGAFRPASTFDGFGDPSGAAIEVTEVDQPYSAIAPQVTAEELAPQGIEIQTRDERTLADGREAILLSGTQTIDGVQTQKIILVTGDDESAVLITANIPFTAPDDIEPMALMMLLSTRLDAEG
jgi:hypothetical protein